MAVSKKKSNAGRPTKYQGQETINKTINYIEGTELPKMSGLSLYLKVDRDTLKEWGKKHPEFSATIKELKEKQEDKIVDGAMTGAYNPTVSIFLLKNNHGYRDKIETENTNKTDIQISGIEYIVPESK